MLRIYNFLLKDVCSKIMKNSKSNITSCPTCNSCEIIEHIPLLDKYCSSKLWPKMNDDIENWDLWVCKNCSHIFADPESYKTTYYASRNAEPELHSHFFKEQPASIAFTLKEVYKYTGKRKLKILDFGCAYGVKANLLARHGHELIGYDIAKKQVAFAAKKYGIKTATGDWEKAKDDIGMVDVIFSEHVFEHIAYPLDTLKSLRKILKPNGVLFLGVPNFASSQVGYLLPEHIHYFNKISIQKLISCASFENIFLRTGLPMISKLYKITKTIPPVSIVHSIDRFTSFTGHYGYSLHILATPKKY